ncbi:MAG TPA: hypothetical protein VFV41_01120 [Streptosporangiaceae bacterium]|nr:hypothetical protein [Streptosporangiaceae bacterium]
MSEVIDLISALRDGTMTLEEVAQRFRERPWPRRASSRPSTYLERAAAVQEDSDIYRPGSFDDVAAAHHEGRLTDQEYSVLSEAVAESKRAEDDRHPGGVADSE